ncbi:MAG: ABC transporter permease [Ignavibacteriales bacterium]|nr:ABC transporter permease [Ignavibacteriales bacterium]
MHAKESFRLGLTGLFSNKTRAALTMLGIVFGVASVISMMSIGEGARRETLQQIEMLGTNNIIINKKAVNAEDGKPAKFSPGLSIKDAQSIMAVNPMLSGITPLRQTELNVLYKSEFTLLNIIGTTPEYPITFNSRMTEGYFFNSSHMENYENVCVIGSGIRNQLFRFENPLKEKLKIGDQWFKIIGIVAPKAISQEGMKSFGLRDFNMDIYIPLSTMTGKMEKLEVNTQAIVRRGNRRGGGNNDDDVKVVDKNSVDQLTAKVKPDADLRAAAALVEKILDRKHFGVKDYQLILPEQLLEQKQKTQKIFNVVMGAIAGISLLVGGIGIMNIMLANILERTREIGIRRAVGATKADILSQFLFEAVTISVTGGVAGIIVGFLLTGAISKYAEWKTVISPVAVLISFFISAATGIIFGIYPAKKAADKNPIESLRYE